MKAFTRSLCVALMLSAGAAWADLSREQAAAAAQRAVEGRVLSVDRADAGGRAAWRVKIVTARGEVRVVFIEAATGRML